MVKHNSIEIREHVNTKHTIRGVKNPNDLKMEGLDEPLPNRVFASILVGTAGSGKTSLLINLLTKRNAYRRKFHKVYWFSPSFRTLPQKFQDMLDPERVFTNLDNLPAIIDSIKKTEDRVLFVFDDCVREIERNKQIIQDLVFNRRHIGGGVSLFIITQKLKSIPLSIRSGMDSVYFYSLRNKKELDNLFEEYTPFLEREEFDGAVRYCREPYCFLFIDITNAKIYKKFNELEFVYSSDEEDE